MGHQTEWGSAGPVQIFGSAGFDPKEGWEQESRWRGYLDDIEALEASYIAEGYQVRTETTGSQWSLLIVKVPSQGEDYTDRYEFNIGFKQQDLFLNIGILSYLRGEGYGDADIVDLKGQLRKALDATQSNASVQGIYGDAAAVIYQMMQMGQEYVEVAQPVLSRKRTYGYQYTGSLMSTYTTQDVWSTTGLISAFGIPGEVAAQMSGDPSATPVENYGYGWKMRKNNLVIIPAKNKIEEQLEWEWDQWSKVAYNYLT